jgi:sec-independent protein translocase protein TatB
MLDVGWSEILIIAVVALVVVGPKELPQLLRTAGQWAARLRRMAGEFQTQMNEAIREAELDDVRKSVQDLRSLSPKSLLAEQISSVGETLAKVERETNAELARIDAETTPGEAPITPIGEPLPPLPLVPDSSTTETAAVEPPVVETPMVETPMVETPAETPSAGFAEPVVVAAAVETPSFAPPAEENAAKAAEPATPPVAKDPLQS